MSSNSLTNKESSLNDIVADIKKGYFAIPSFQRGIVWKQSDIHKLGDSLLWGYPISSLLLMPISSMLDVKYESLAVEGIEKSDPAKANYVLDGQQRLTACAKLFVEKSCDTVFYYDLLGILIKGYELGNARTPEEFQKNGVFENGILDTVKRYKPEINAGDDYVCKGFKKTKNREFHETRENHRYIRCDVVLNCGFGKYVNKFLREYFDDVSFQDRQKLDDAIDNCTDYLTGILGALRLYGVPITLINEGSDLDLVCSVFERVNSSGVKLTTFDLVNAKTFGYEEHEGGFASYLKVKFSKSDKKESLNRFFDGSTTGYTDLARIIRILHVADKLANGFSPELTNGAMLQHPKEFWFTNFDNVALTLYTFIDWAENEGLTSFAPKTFVEYMAAIAIAVPESMNVYEFKRDLVKFGLSLSIHNQVFNKSNLKIVTEFLAYAKQLVSANEWARNTIQMPPYVNGSAITTTDVLACHYRGRGLKYAAMMDVMYGQNKNGLFTCDIFGFKPEFKLRYDPVTNDSKLKFDEHHLIPKGSVSNGAISGIDSIANIALISKGKNISLGNTRFEEYFRNMHRHSVNKQDLFGQFEANLIPTEYLKKAVTGVDFSSDDYKGMLDTRAGKIAEYINAYFNFYDRVHNDDNELMTDDDA